MTVDDRPAAAPTTVPAPVPPARNGQGRRLRLMQGARHVSTKVSFARASGVYLLVVFIALFGLLVPETFLTTTTLRNVATEQAVTAILAIGLLFPLAAGNFDLSIGYTAGATGILAAWLVADQSINPVLAIAIVLLFGLAIGATNGVLVVVFGVDSFIATLGMSSILAAAIFKISGNTIIPNLPDSFNDIARINLGGIPILVVYLVIIATAAWCVLEHTATGRRFYAIGAGREASRLAGVPTNRIVFVSLMISGFMGAIGGILVTAKLGTGSPGIGPPYLLPVFAAAFFGTTQLKVGRFNVWGTVLAVYLFATGVKGLQLLGGENWVTDLFNGVALIVAVTLARADLRARLSRRRARRDAGTSGTSQDAATVPEAPSPTN